MRSIFFVVLLVSVAQMIVCTGQGAGSRPSPIVHTAHPGKKTAASHPSSSSGHSATSPSNGIAVQPTFHILESSQAPVDWLNSEQFKAQKRRRTPSHLRRYDDELQGKQGMGSKGRALTFEEKMNRLDHLLSPEMEEKMQATYPGERKGMTNNTFNRRRAALQRIRESTYSGENDIELSDMLTKAVNYASFCTRRSKRCAEKP